MKPTPLLKLAILSTVIITGAAQADKGATRSKDSLPAISYASYHASEKSNGLPNADGHKPGNGNGYGHDKDHGLGHEYGQGHGHDDDHPDSPG